MSQRLNHLLHRLEMQFPDHCTRCKGFGGFEDGEWTSCSRCVDAGIDPLAYPQQRSSTYLEGYLADIRSGKGPSILREIKEEMDTEVRVLDRECVESYKRGDVSVLDLSERYEQTPKEVWTALRKLDASLPKYPMSEIREFYKRSGFTQAHVAEIYGMSANTLRLHLGGSVKKERFDWDAIKRDYEQGYTLKMLDKKYGVKHWHIKREGIKKGKSKVLPLVSILDDHQKGMSYQELAVKYEVDERVIEAKILKAKKPTQGGCSLEQMFNDYQSGMSYQEIATFYGLTKQAVGYRLKKYGLVARPIAKEIPTSEIIAKYQQGQSLTQLKNEYGVAHNRIRNLLLKNGVELRAYLSPHVEQIRQAYLDGSSCEKIAEALGIAPQTVAWHLHKLGVKMRKRSDYKGSR